MHRVCEHEGVCIEWVGERECVEWVGVRECVCLSLWVVQCVVSDVLCAVVFVQGCGFGSSTSTIY